MNRIEGKQASGRVYSCVERENFVTRCYECGNRIRIGEGCYSANGKPYCEECVESADLQNLIRICETEADELYRSIGLRHGFIGSERG